MKTQQFVRNKTWRLAGLVASIVLTLDSAEFADSSSLWAADVDVAQVVDPFLKDRPYLAVVVGTVTPNETSFRAFGQIKQAETSRPPDENSLFEIGSITKSFTGTLLAVLVREGKVRLDSPANQFLKPEWRVPRDGDREITLLDLATHSSGLPVQPPLIGLFAMTHQSSDNPYSKFDGVALANTMKPLKLQSAIGKEYRYSNLGVGLLGHALVSAAEASSFESLLRDRLLGPLKLDDTTITLSEAQRAKLAQPHNGTGTRTPPWDFATLEACGGLRSSAADLVRWVEAHLGKRESPLWPALQMSHESRFPVDAPKDPQALRLGLCWHLISVPQRPERVVFHNGGTYGSRSFLAFDPESKVGVVILSNSAHSVDNLGLEIMRRMLEASKVRPK